MFCISRVFVIYFLINCAVCLDSSDSYLSALKKSHDVDTLPDRGDFPGQYSDNSVIPSGPGYDYFNTKPNYGPPPSAVYEPSKPVYGPPPVSGPSYPFYGHTTSIQFNPYSAPPESWLDKLKLKFDLFTIGKILLKLILFKKVIKFLAILCLLLFLPKLQDKSDITMNDEERQFSAKNEVNARLNEITDFATSSMAAFLRKNPDACPNVSCRFMKMVDTVDEQYPLNKILDLYGLQ